MNNVKKRASVTINSDIAFKDGNGPIKKMIRKPLDEPPPPAPPSKKK